VESQTTIGHVTAAAAAALDLPPGIPVVAGGGDAECAAVGMGLVGEPLDAGVALLNIGTAAQVFVLTDMPLTVAATGLQTLCHAVPGRWHVMAGLLSGSSTLDWLASALATPDAAPVSPTGLLDEATAEPPGARGLLFLPHLRGTRMPVPDPAVRGAFVGLCPEHSRATLTRAVLEGVALALAEALQTVRTAGIEVREVRLAGGARRHPLWSRLLADALGLPVRLGATEDASAFGAALLAALGVGALPSSGAIGRLARPHGPAVLPDASAHALYRNLARLASQTTIRLRPTFRSLSTLS
jgi:sugar (pentulose or hexulose) kinase